jgi:hypothetical protein
MVAVMIRNEESVGRWLKNWMELVCRQADRRYPALKKMKHESTVFHPIRNYKWNAHSYFLQHHDR